MQQASTRTLILQRESHLSIKRGCLRISELVSFSPILASASSNSPTVLTQIHDTIDPSLRLVAHNRNPSTLRDRSQTKLLPSESVLSSSELEAQQHERLAAVAARGVEAGGGSAGPSRAGSEGGEGGAGEESEGREREKVREKTRGKEREKLRRVKSGLRNVSLEGEGLITIEGVKIPTITSRQWREALSIAEVRLPHPHSCALLPIRVEAN